MNQGFENPTTDSIKEEESSVLLGRREIERKL